MRRLFLYTILMYLGLVRCFAQRAEDSSIYHSRELTFDEVNLVSAYYTQDGNNSAVTGGRGTEYLTDWSNNLTLKFSHYDRKNRINTIAAEIGVDAYSSASSDKIDPNTISSASSSDTRIYPSLAWHRKNTEKGSSWGVKGSYSEEYDYISYGLGFDYTKTSRDESREFGLRLGGFMDTWRIVLPIELRSAGDPQTAPRNSVSAAFSLSQVVNQRLQVALVVEPGYQEGQLATRFQRVYFTDNTVHSENLPGSRWKVATGIRAHYFAGDRFILRGFYRFFTDQWNLQGHTFSLETPVKILPLVSFSPFYRYYVQQASAYFAPYGEHKPGTQFYTSDFDLSELSSHAAGAGLRLTPQNGIFGIGIWNTFEIRYEHYMRSTGLTADIVTIGLTFTPHLPIARALRGISN